MRIKETLEGFPFEPHIFHSLDDLESKVVDWATDRGIIGGASVDSQMRKLREEVQELAEAITLIDMDQVVDGIGDCAVVLINMARIAGTDLRTCLQAAWDEIKDRTGRMENGVFVKDGPGADPAQIAERRAELLAHADWMRTWPKRDAPETVQPDAARSITTARDRLRVLEQKIAHQVAGMIEQYADETGLHPSAVAIHMQDVSGLGDEQRRHVVLDCDVEVVL